MTVDPARHRHHRDSQHERERGHADRTGAPCPTAQRVDGQRPECEHRVGAHQHAVGEQRERQQADRPGHPAVLAQVPAAQRERAQQRGGHADILPDAAVEQQEQRKSPRGQREPRGAHASLAQQRVGDQREPRPVQHEVIDQHRDRPLGDPAQQRPQRRHHRRVPIGESPGQHLEVLSRGIRVHLAGEMQREVGGEQRQRHGQQHAGGGARNRAAVFRDDCRVRHADRLNTTLRDTR